MIALTAARTAAILRLKSSEDQLFYQVLIICWTQAELAYSLATMTLPCLMSIMTKFDTTLGALDRQTVAASSLSGAYALSKSKSRLRSAVTRNSQHIPLGSEVQSCELAWSTSQRYLADTCGRPYRFTLMTFELTRQSTVPRQMMEALRAMIARGLLRR